MRSPPRLARIFVGDSDGTVPGAIVVELDEDGAHQRDDDDLEVVGLWRRFLGDPESFLGPLLAD
jgi:hypothetical protein